ncbi:MAG: tryptophan--tRNA ligase, partial [Candidatus Bathyarchaeota archaeon]
MNHNTSNSPNDMIVTPWTVSGTIDYGRLIRKFGTQPLTAELLQRIAKRAGSLHPLLEREH